MIISVVVVSLNGTVIMVGARPFGPAVPPLALKADFSRALWTMLSILFFFSGSLDVETKGGFVVVVAAAASAAAAGIMVFEATFSRAFCVAFAMHFSHTPADFA